MEVACQTAAVAVAAAVVAVTTEVVAAATAEAVTAVDTAGAAVAAASTDQAVVAAATTAEATVAQVPLFPGPYVPNMPVPAIGLQLGFELLNHHWSSKLVRLCTSLCCACEDFRCSPVSLLSCVAEGTAAMKSPIDC